MIKKFVLGLLTFSVLSVPFAPASENLFQFQAPDIDGEKLSLRQFEGQVVLVVNTASKCGYTYQYEGLEKVYRQFKDRGFVVLGFPSDDFWQEYNSNEEIKEFCEVNFNINFPMTSKTDVKGENAHEIYKWAFKNYGKSAIPKWNFHKILINQEGKVEETYMSFTKPTSKKIINKIEKILN